MPQETPESIVRTLPKVFSNYNDLNQDGALIEGDTIIFKNNNTYRVMLSTGRNRWYLENYSNPGYNDMIFRDVNITDPESWVYSVLNIRTFGGVFPEVSNSHELFTVVLNLFRLLEGLPGIDSSDGKIIFSDDFKNVLLKAEPHSKICKILLNRRSELDVSKINYLASGYDEFISYLPNGKNIEYNSDGSWSSKNRQSGKPSRVVKSLFTGGLLKEVNDSDFEKFANLYKSINHDMGYFEIVEGQSIADWYNVDRYYSDAGTLSTSCMRYESCKSFFGIYTHNPEIIKMLILIGEDNKLLGRAILWHLPNGIKIMDRIYGKDSTIQKFKLWAYDNGYYLKTRNNNDVECGFTDKEGNKIGGIQIHLKYLDFPKYPYMDTLCYMDRSKTYLTDSMSMADDGFELRCTSGSIQIMEDEDDDDDDYINCDYSGDRIYRDEAVYVEDVGDVYVNYTRYCMRSHEYYMREDTFTCDWSGDIFHKDYMIQTVEGYTVCEHHHDLVKLVNGDYTSSANYFVSDYDGDNYHINDRYILEVPETGSMYTISLSHVEEMKEQLGILQ